MTTYPVTLMGVRRAEWVWRERPSAPPGFGGMFANARPFEQERNRFVYFRKTFTLTDAPDSALLHISADGRYQLFVNGALVGRGPARCDAAHQYYDSYDIAEHLRAGSNVIAVLGHSYGQFMAWYEPPRYEAARLLGCGGIFVQSDIQTGAETIHVDTDESWRYLESAAWQHDTSGGAVGFVEIYDARQAPVGWQEADYDDRAWQPAQVLIGATWPRTPPVRPFPFMTPRDIPPLMEEKRSPVRLERAAQVAEVSGTPNLPQQIGAETLADFTTCLIDGEKGLLDGSEAVIQTSRGQAVALVFDFGGTVTGRPVLEFTAPAGAIIDVGTSERLQDGHIEPREQSFLTSENIDRVIAREGRQTWERFEWTGFRYLQLTVRNAETPLTLHSVSLNFTSYPVEARGAFECSDSLLNDIWQAGANTLQLCMHDGFVDCPQREQRQFAGDGYVEALINFAAFGDPYLTGKMVRQFFQQQRIDGLTNTTAPGDGQEMGAYITDYCLYWIMTIREYVRYTGDAAIVQELYPGVERALTWFSHYVDDEGLLNNPPHWLFVDWAEVDKRGQSTAVNAQYAHTLEMAAELADIYGLPARAVEFRAQAESVKASINRLLWDDVRGAYVDCRVDGVQSTRISQQSNGFCLAYGVAAGTRRARVIAYVTDPARVGLTAWMPGNYQPPPFDEASDVVLAQPFCAHHLHRGLAVERTDLLLDNIRQRWGAMIAAGSTTIWEVWSADNSQCHAWSATPTFDLSSYVLGVMPLADGFAEALVAPHPADLAWARGRFPTPHGAIEVDWERADGRFSLTVDAPENVALQILLPLEAKRVAIDGQGVWVAGQATPPVNGWAIEASGQETRLTSTRGGGYSIVAE